MSIHSVDVIRIGEILRHPNADSIGLVKIGEYTCAVKLGDFKPGDLACYIEPDYIVPDNEKFAFLGGNRRIKAKRLRGTWSQGLLIKAEPGMNEGDNVMEALGIERWEPPEPGESRGPNRIKGPAVGLCESVPNTLRVPKYDIENWRKYGKSIFEEGEEVIITEKIHGMNARFASVNGIQYCGGRTQWRKQEPANDYWRAFNESPWIKLFCDRNPGTVLYGEIYGTQDMKYGLKPGQLGFLAFDAYEPETELFWEHEALINELYEVAISIYGVGEKRYMDFLSVPLVFQGPYTHDTIAAFAEGSSNVAHAEHGREGIVIKPVLERFNPITGRTIAKCVSNWYMERMK